MTTAGALQLENKGLLLQIVENRFLLVQSSAKGLDLYDAATMQLALRVISPLLGDLGFFGPGARFHVAVRQGKPPVILSQNPKSKRLLLATSDNRVFATDARIDCGFKFAGEYLVAAQAGKVEVYRIGEQGLQKLRVPADVGSATIADCFAEENRLVLLLRDRLALVVLERQPDGEFGAGRTFQFASANNHLQNVEFLSLGATETSAVLSDASGCFYYLNLANSEGAVPVILRTPGVFQEGLFDIKRRRFYTRNGKTLTAYELRGEQFEKTAQQAFSNEFTFVRVGTGALLFLSITKSEILFQKTEFEAVLEFKSQTVEQPSAERPRAPSSSDTLKQQPIKRSRTFRQITFSNIESLISENLEVPESKFYTAFADILKLNSMAVIEQFVRTFGSKAPANLVSLAQTILVFSKHFGYASLDFFETFFNHLPTAPLPTPSDVLIALLDTYAKDLGTVMKARDLIVLSEVPQLDLEAAKTEFAQLLVRSKNALLFQHLDREALQSLFLKTVDSNNLDFFSQDTALITANDKLTEILRILANFHVTFDRSATSHDFSLLSAQLARNLLCDNSVHQVFEYEHEPLYYKQYSIIKLYNTLFYVLSDLHVLLSKKLSYPPTGPAFDDAFLLEVFFKELLRAGRTEDLYDVANFKKDLISVQSFESDLFHFAQNTLDSGVLKKLQVLIPKLRGLKIFSFKLDVVGQLVDSRMFLEEEKLTAFEDAFTFKQPDDFARNFAGYFKGFKRQLKVREFEDRERKLAPSSRPLSREQYAAQMLGLKPEKESSLKDPQMVDFITRTIDLFTSNAKNLSFEKLFDSLLEIGVRPIFVGVLNRFLKTNGIPESFWNSTDNNAKLKPFLSKNWQFYNDNLGLTENLVLMLVEELTDYESLANLESGVRRWATTGRRADLSEGKRYVSFKRDALEDICELRVEKKPVEEVESLKGDSEDKANEGRLKVVVRYLLSEPETAEYFFYQFFGLQAGPALEQNFDLLLRAVKASWKFKSVAGSNVARTDKFLKAVIARTAEDKATAETAQIDSLKLFRALFERDFKDLSPSVLEDFYDLELLNKAFADPVYAEEFLKLKVLPRAVLWRFVKRNKGLIIKDLPLLTRLNETFKTTAEDLLHGTKDNTQLYNLIMLQIFCEGRMTSEAEQVRLLSLLPTVKYDARTAVKVENGRLSPDLDAVQKSLETATDKAVQTTLSAVLVKRRAAALMAEIDTEYG